MRDWPSFAFGACGLKPNIRFLEKSCSIYNFKLFVKTCLIDIFHNNEHIDTEQIQYRGDIFVHALQFKFYYCMKSHLDETTEVHVSKSINLF